MGYEPKGLQDKVVLITGAERGQGASHALNLAEAGCDVAAFDVTGQTLFVDAGRSL